MDNTVVQAPLLLLWHDAEQDTASEELKLQALQEIKQFILQFEWITQERTKEELSIT